MMNRTDQKLKWLYIFTVAVALLICLFFEVICPDYFGFLFDEKDNKWRTIFEAASIFAGLAGIYGALRLMSLPFIINKVKNEDAYLKYAIIRWMLLAVALFLSETTYYFFSSTNVVAFVGICAIALLFVWPTKGRRMREMGVETEEQKA